MPYIKIGSGPEPSWWHELSGEALLDKLRVNTVVSQAITTSLQKSDDCIQGPFLTSKHFHPNLKQAAGKIINISSNLASISGMYTILFLLSPYHITLLNTVLENKEGENMAYRISKAALNQLTASMAAEFMEAGDGIAVMSVYPGYVPTRMTNYRSRDDMAECIAGVVKVIEGLDMSQTGTFVNWKNETIPW